MPSCNSHGLSLPPPKTTFLKLQLNNKKPVELLNVFLASSTKEKQLEDVQKLLTSAISHHRLYGGSAPVAAVC